MLQIIGVDSATEASKTGVARCEYAADGLVLRDAELCSKRRPPAAIVAEWIATWPSQTLLAIDAPLGWPAPLRAIGAHQAGELLAGTADELFRRETDRHVEKRVGQRSLDVGADRIARTAHAALGLLHQVREASGRTIPLAWAPDSRDDVSVIEVYPAATLRMLAVRNGNYKKPDQRAARHEIAGELSTRVRLGLHVQLLEEEADVLDAVVCCMAGGDFIAGKGVPPSDLSRAKSEGWIWVRGA